MRPAPHQVDLWVLRHPAASLTTSFAVLSPAERERQSALLDERRRTRFVLGRALLRQVLSRYEPSTEPGEWRFEAGGRGKPRVAGGDGPHFSLSHGDGVSVVAVGGSEVGVDVERIGATDHLEIAQQFFPPDEAKEIERAGAHRAEVFAQKWVLKEALAKAGEFSLADVMGGTSFAVRAPEHIDVAYSRELPSQPNQWRFGIIDLHPQMLIGVAVRTEAPRLRIRKTDVIGGMDGQFQPRETATSTCA